MDYVNLHRMQDFACWWQFIICIINIISILPQKNPMFNIANAIFFDLSLSNILIIGFFCSNNSMVMFSKTEKNS